MKRDAGGNDMSNLTRLKELVDRHMQNISMTEAQKADVRRKIIERKTTKTPRRLPRPILAGACALAGLLLVVGIAMPMFADHSQNTGSDMATDDTADMGGFWENDTEESTTDCDAGSIIPDGMTFDVLAMARTSGVVTPDTAFSIEVTGGTIAADTLADAIVIEPAVDFTLTTEQENRYTLTPSEPFDAGEIVTVSIRVGETSTRSWAFQTEASLCVESTLPADCSVWVPLNTGIELNFSRIMTDGIADAFAISPEAAGSFEVYGKTVAFVPAEPLDAGTTYTVTVAPGIAAQSGEVMQSAYSFQFTTALNAQGTSDNYGNAGDYTATIPYLSDTVTETFVPGDAIAVRIYVGDDITETEVMLYEIPTASKYRELAAMHYESARYDRYYNPREIAKDLVFPTDELTYLDTFTTELVELQPGSWNNPVVAILPDLDEGWYLANFHMTDSVGNTQMLQKLIQVGSISAYYLALNGESLLWLNDTNTGDALAHATATLTVDGESFTAQTDADGVAAFRYAGENPQSNTYALLEITEGDRHFVEYVPIDGTSVPHPADLYHYYVYLDRPLYMPTDTIRFWGYLKPRSGAVLPETLRVETHSGNVDPLTVQVNPDGTFSGEIAFSEAESGYYCLTFFANDTQLFFKDYTVTEYAKPTYVLDLTFDQPYYRIGDTMEATVTGTFFDETPATGVLVAISKDMYGKVVTLDETGSATVQLPHHCYHDDWFPTMQYAYASITGAEDVYTSASASVFYFPSDYMLTVEQREGDDLRAEIRSNAIDFAAYDQTLGYPNAERIRGEAADVSGTATLVRSYYRKYESGSYYDPINKVSVPTYDYDLIHETVRVENFMTENGRYITDAVQNPDYSDNAYYTLEVAYTSPDGVPFTSTLYLSSSRYPGAGYGKYLLGDTELASGEQGVFTLTGAEIAEDGRMFYAISKSRFVQVGTENGTVIHPTFTEEMAASANLFSAYFDGRHVHQVQQLWLNFDSSERELTVEILPDAEQYGPGDTITGSIRITDVNGQPVSANYAIGVVDEAIFAIQEQHIDPLSMLYDNCYYTQPMSYASYVDKTHEIIYAEGGGGDGFSEIRRDFEDTAAFLTGVTGTDGTASFSFSLPDNLTSWRITAVGITEDVCAGSAQRDIITTIPFFLNLVLSDSYTLGDDIALSARVFGTEVSGDVRYSVLLNGEEVAATTGVAGTYAYLSLGELHLGSHEVIVFAECGEHRDAIARTITVVESRHELTTRTRGDLADGIAVDAVKFPVRVLVYDPAQHLTMDALTTLLSMQGVRADQQLARNTAATLLHTLDPENAEWAALADIAPAVSQDRDGGVRLLPYATVDAEVTAMVLLTAPERIQSGSAIAYLYDILGDREASSGMVAAAYLGLAAMREPVLADLHVLLNDLSGFTDDDRVLLACALAVLGDDTSALTLYHELVAEHSETSSNWRYVSLGGTEENYRATTYALILSSLLDLPECDAYAHYLLEIENRETLPAFALMVYLAQQHVAPSDTTFTVQWEGETQTFSLRDTPVVTFLLDRKALEAADFRVLSGEAAYTAVFSGGMDAISANAGDAIDVQTSLASETPAAGDAVEIRVTATFDEGCPGDLYTLDLVLPAGLRYVDCDIPARSGCYLLRQEDDRLTFLLDRDPHNPQTATLRTVFNITIRTNAVVSGTYVLEEPIVSGIDSGLTAIGKRTEVPIA